MKTVFVLDKVEFKYFEINELVTSFWLIKECLERGSEVYITTMDKLYLDGNKPQAYLYKTSLINKNEKQEMIYDKKNISACLNNFDLILFRPDPPITMEYIFATYILDFVDKLFTQQIQKGCSAKSVSTE